MKLGHKVALFCVLLLGVFILMIVYSNLFMNTLSAEKLQMYIEDNPELLAEFLEYVDGKVLNRADLPLKYRNVLDGRVRYLDARNGKNVYVHLSGGFDNAEADTLLQYHPDNCYEWGGVVYADLPADGVIAEGLGINGQGYVHCKRLAENWFFVETYFPT